MPKITDQELEKRLVHLFKSDVDLLRRLYGQELGVNRAIRAIVHSFCTQTQAKADVAIDAVEHTAENLL